MTKPNEDCATSSPLNEEVDSLVEKLLQEWHVPGLSIAVVDNGKVYCKGYGYASLPSTAATPDTLWFAGSTTKAFVAAAVGLLIEDPSNRTLKWTTPVKDILKDDFVLQDEYVTNTTTIEDALSHRSGMMRHDLAYGWTGSDQLSVVRLMRHLPISQTFRTSWNYCNTMYATVGALLENVTGKPTSQVLRELIWEPLGMNSTFFDLPSAAEHSSKHTINNLARGYYWLDPEMDPDSSKFDSEASFISDLFTDLSAVSAAGANISSVRDYSLWIKALLTAAAECPPKAGTKPDPNSVITPSLFTSLTTPRCMMTPWPFPDSEDLKPNLNPDLYGLAWFISPRSFPGEVLVHHAGGLAGYGTQVLLLPEHNFGIVTMGNTASTSNAVGEIVGYDLIGTKLGYTEEKRRKVREWRAKHWKWMLNPGSRKDDEDNMAATDEKEKEKEKSKHASVNEILAKNTSLPSGLDAKWLEGEYFNPGYGTYVVKLVDQAYLDNMQIRRRKPKSGVKTADNHEAKMAAAAAAATGVLADLEPTVISAATMAVTSSPETPSLASTPEKNDKQIILHVSFKERHTWQGSFILRHESGNFFSTELLQHHGNLGDGRVNAGEFPLPGEEAPGIVYEGGDVMSAGAAFAGGSDNNDGGGGGAAKMGIVLLADMDAKAVREGKGWEEGMMWFERV